MKKTRRVKVLIVALILIFSPARVEASKIAEDGNPNIEYSHKHHIFNREGKSKVSFLDIFGNINLVKGREYEGAEILFTSSTFNRDFEDSEYKSFAIVKVSKDMFENHRVFKKHNQIAMKDPSGWYIDYEKIDEDGFHHKISNGSVKSALILLIDNGNEQLDINYYYH